MFGAPLAEAVRHNGPVDVKVPLPAVVYRCIQYLDAKNAVTEEGIFRLSGSNVLIKQLRERFNNESDVNLLADEHYHDIHAVASLLKMYLRELPTTILTRDLHMEFLSVTEIQNQREKLAALSELALRLPQANATLLKYLIAFLIKIINNSDTNKMTVRNVGIVFLAHPQHPRSRLRPAAAKLPGHIWHRARGIRAAIAGFRAAPEPPSLGRLSPAAAVDLPSQRVAPPPASSRRRQGWEWRGRLVTRPPRLPA